MRENTLSERQNIKRGGGGGGGEAHGLPFITPRIWKDKLNEIKSGRDRKISFGPNTNQRYNYYYGI